jgi:hypothetical protein
MEMGRCPSRPQAVSPALRYASPFPLAADAHVSRVGDPPLLAVATPRVRHVAFGMSVHAAHGMKSKSNRKGE